MRTVTPAQTAAETAIERRVAYLFHFYVDDADGERVWDWCYTDAESTVTFTGLDAIERVFEPKAMSLADDKVMEQSSEIRSNKTVKLTTERVEPFLAFFGSQFPFPIKLHAYKIYRADLSFYDLLPVDEVGAVEIEAARVTVSLLGKFRVLSRKLPQPIYGPGCWKRLFSTGPFGCRADKAHVTCVPCSPIRVDQNILWFSDETIKAGGDEWFDRGLAEYDADVTPVEGESVSVHFAPNILASCLEEIANPENPEENIECMRIELDYAPPLMTTSTPVTLVAGCRRTMADCRNKHLPVGGDTEGLAGNFKNFGATPHIPPQNGVMTSTVECK